MDTRSAIDAFEEQLRLERNHSEHTVKAYLSDLRKFLQSIGKSDIGSVRTEDIRGFIKELQEMGISIATQARTLSSIKAFFRFLLEEGELEEDPSALIEMPRSQRRIPDVLSPEEIDSVLAHIDPSDPMGHRDRAIIEVLYGCGLRVTELIGLRISDLHFEEGHIRVRGKGSKERLVPFGKPAQEAVKQYLQHEREGQGAAHRHEDILFLNRNGKGLSRVMIFYIARDTAKKAGIQKKVSPHTYRHSFATHLVEGGADLMAVREMLGHASVTTTEIYSHLDQSYLQEELVHHHPRSSKNRRGEGFGS